MWRRHQIKKDENDYDMDICEEWTDEYRWELWNGNQTDEGKEDVLDYRGADK